MHTLRLNYFILALSNYKFNMRKILVFLVMVGVQFTILGQQKPVTVKDVWQKYAFYARTTGGIKSMNDGEHFTALERTSEGMAIQKYSYKTGKLVSTITSIGAIEEATGKKLNFDKYQFGPEEDRLLLGVQTEGIYRHSSQSYFYVFNLANKTLDSLQVEGKQRLADFSPTQNKVAYVYENRMHIQDLDNNETVSFGQGAEDAFIAGAVDWVYEEEFSFHKGFEWSPEGNYLAYYQFDEREVPTFSMDVYGKALYPQQQVFKYPKAGEVNSKVSIHIYDVQNNKDYTVTLPENYEYIPRIKWTQEDDELAIFTLNRLQNKLTLWEVEVEKKGLEVEKIYQETAEAYLEVHDNLRFLKDESFIWTSEKDGYNHIYHIDEDGEVIRQITSGPWEVTEFYGIDEETNTLYYQAAEESPLRRGVYSIDLKGKNKTRLSPKKGWNSASFSDGFTYFINEYSSSTTPTQQALRDSKGNLVREITTNNRLQERIAGYAISEKEFFNFTTEGGVNLNGWMIKPLDFDPNKEYPLLMFVYGGPGSQTVQDKYDGFNGMWYQVLASKGYVVVSVDNRGTGARGRDFRTNTYQQLGKNETEDQIAAARYLGNLNFIDSSRIGIWGWSYGGYMSSLALFKGNETFKTAIAVAPVTNWRFYDNIYTERYMRTPQENASGYDQNSPINYVDQLKGNYLLVHGTGDDNVHVQNTMRMVSALVNANKQFDLFVYPDKAHGIGGGNTRLHLYTKMTNFLLENL
jgi:dipeptidyl-peptidase-4